MDFSEHAGLQGPGVGAIGHHMALVRVLCMCMPSVRPGGSAPGPGSRAKKNRGAQFLTPISSDLNFEKFHAT